MGKFIKWGIVIFIVFYIATQPEAAAGTAHTILNGLHSAANSMARFMGSLGGQS
jgi:hypothetical protein